MEYLSVREAADRLGISPRRVQQLCRSSMIPGVVRKGRRWLIPATVSSIREEAVLQGCRKNLPIGISDFRNAVTNYYYRNSA